MMRGLASRLTLRHGVEALIALRAIMAALIPLTADEAYYWLWSKHLDAGYMDHPPAIAWLIRPGTALLGDTVLGVRLFGIALSILATVFVWKSALTLLQSRTKADMAALLFNLTLMVSVEMLAMTPDMPSVVTSAAFLFCLVRLQGSGQAKYWLWAGLAAGLSLLSKYSGLFLIAGGFLWLVLSPKARDARGRHWLATPWPWAGALLALGVFAPNLLWQAGHDWDTFRFQFGRVVGGHLTAKYILEFLGAQLALASPFVFILGVMGLAGARRSSALFLPACLLWPAVLYFAVHASHDRVQGNWPCFLYPAFVILALSVPTAQGWRKWCARLAAPVAALFLFVTYAQALTGVLPLGRGDPLARLLGVGFKPVADGLVSAARAQKVGAVLTTDYETTAWLRFYEPGLKVVHLEELSRYPHAPMADAALMQGPLFYFVSQKRDDHARVAKYFSVVLPGPMLRVERKGAELALYQIYLVEKPKGPVAGRMP